jgi:hypothetical protein
MAAAFFTTCCFEGLRNSISGLADTLFENFWFALHCGIAILRDFRARLPRRIELG